MKNIKKLNLIFIFFLFLFCRKVSAQIEMNDPLELPRSDRYTIEMMTCKNSEGKNIYGVAYTPKGKQGEKYPTVIFSHSFSSSHMFHFQYGYTLAENSISCYCFDFCGGSNISKSEGNTTVMSVLTEKKIWRQCFVLQNLGNSWTLQISSCV